MPRKCLIPAIKTQAHELEETRTDALMYNYLAELIFGVLSDIQQSGFEMKEPSGITPDSLNQILHHKGFSYLCFMDRKRVPPMDANPQISLGFVL